MSRVTPPVTKIVHTMRRVSLSAQPTRSFVLVPSQSRYCSHSVRSLKSELNSRRLNTSGNKPKLGDRLFVRDIIRRQSTLFGDHRPNPSSFIETPLNCTRHLIQTFNTYAPKQAAHDPSTIDFFFFPEVPEPPPANPFSRIRVPLLPDNYNPDRSHHAVESLDKAVPRPEIAVVASHPEHVLPAAMSEVVGNDSEESSIEDLTKVFKETVEKGTEQVSAVRQVWNGILDDLFVGKGPKAT